MFLQALTTAQSPAKTNYLYMLKKFEFRTLARQLPDIMQLSDDDVAQVTADSIELVVA